MSSTHCFPIPSFKNKNCYILGHHSTSAVQNYRICDRYIYTCFKVHVHVFVVCRLRGQYHYKCTSFVIYREVVLFSEVLIVLKLYREINFLGTSRRVPCIEVFCTVSLSQRVPYWRFHCITVLLNTVQVSR